MAKVLTTVSPGFSCIGQDRLHLECHNTVVVFFAPARIPFKDPSSLELATGAVLHQQLGFPGAGTQVSRTLISSFLSLSQDFIGREEMDPIHRVKWNGLSQGTGGFRCQQAGPSPPLPAIWLCGLLGPVIFLCSISLGAKIKN